MVVVLVNSPEEDHAEIPFPPSDAPPSGRRQSRRRMAVSPCPIYLWWCVLLWLSSILLLFTHYGTLRPGTLSLVCVDPEFGLAGLRDLRPLSMLFASGTLHPIEDYATDIGK